MATSSAMSDKRRLLAEMAARADTRGGSARRTGRRIAAAVAVIAVVACGWWWMSRGPAPPPEVLEVRSIVDAKIAELAQVERNEIPLPSDSGINAVFDKMRDMPQDVRGQAGREIGRLFEARERAEVRSYFALPPAERPKELARRVAADEARRKAREAERASRGGPGGPGQQAGAGSRGGPPGGGPGGPGGGPPGGVAGRSSSEEARNDRRKQGIDRSTPEDRAQRSEYRRAYDALRRAGRS